MDKIWIRVLLFFVVFSATVMLPWWVTVPVLVACTIYFSSYFEVIFFGFLIDSLYASSYVFPYKGLTTAIVLLLVVSFVKTRIRT